MKNSKIKYIAVIFLALLLVAFQSSNDDEQRSQVLFDIVTQSLVRNHYSEVDIDDDFSERTYQLFIERLDYSKRFLLKSDIEELSYFEDKIDDEIKMRTHMLLNRAVEILDERTKEAKQYYEEILSHPFDYTIDESFEFDSDKRDYPADKSEMKEVWRKLLKYQTMSRILTMEEEQEEAVEKSDTVTIRDFKYFEEKARKKVLKTNNDWFHRISQLEFADRRAIFLNAITGAFDPHTTFFPPKEKDNFDIAMSGQLEGIGATLTSKDGYITVKSIVPGSASWRQGELEAKDKILKVAQGDDEPVDIVDMRLDNAVKLIRGPKGTEVRLTVKKIDGSIVVIPIIRDVVIIEETYASSLIINDKKKLGYIKLPKFYFDVNKKDGRNCYDDMAKEVDKLNDENVNGIIIDLRDNGGGSLQDVVKIAGLFIADGPVVQVKARNRVPYIFEDKDSEILYGGPLVVMVNSFSASASEILAAALQDYNRAVIVGSASTFGKGTVQRILNFDDMLPPSLENLKPLGAMKVTMQKFYRINGGTTQLKGVIPDIILPNNYSYIEVGEKELEFPLKYDKIENADYNVWDSKFLKKLNDISKKSESRVAENEIFELIKENAIRLKRRKDNSELSLNYIKYKEHRKQIEEDGEKYKQINKEPTGLELANLAIDSRELGNDTLKIESSKKMIDKLSKDVYLHESVDIIIDLINE